MKITSIMVTRERPKYINRAVRSLVERVDDLDNYEVIVGFDADDQRSIDSFNEFKEKELKDVNVVTYIFKERYGWSRGHDYFNEQVKIANGDYIAMWADNFEMHTRNWDKIIRESYADKFCLVRTNILNGNCWLATNPIFPKKWSELLGRITGPCLDLWMGVVAYELGIFVEDPRIMCSYHALRGTAHHGQENYKFWDRRHIWEKDIEVLREYIKSINQEPIIYPGPKPY